MIFDLFEYSFNGLKRRKIRTWLTLIAIIIGVSLVIALVSIGDGLKYNINQELDKFGVGNIIIIPGSSEKTMQSAMGPNGQLILQDHLWDKDVDMLKSLPGIESVDSMVITGSTTITFRGKQVTSPVYGFSSTHLFDYLKTYSIEKGRNIKPGDKHVAVLGYGFANDLFDEKLDVGSKIYINGVRYRVIGILSEIGGISGNSDDSVIYVPYDEAVDMAGNRLLKGEVSVIYVHTNGDIDKMVERIRGAIRNSHKLGNEEDDFTIITAEFVKHKVDSILNAITVFLGFISGISLFVGGIGIMNTMYMVIIERTREIGTLKAIGAKDKDIMTAFVIESTLLGLIGGVIGICLGLIFSNVIAMFGLYSTVDIELILITLSIVVILGVIAGIIPAMRVLKMDPSDALRYE